MFYKGIQIAKSVSHDALQWVLVDKHSRHWETSEILKHDVRVNCFDQGFKRSCETFSIRLMTVCFH